MRFWVLSEPSKSFDVCDVLVLAFVGTVDELL